MATPHSLKGVGTLTPSQRLRPAEDWSHRAPVVSAPRSEVAFGCDEVIPDIIGKKRLSSRADVLDGVKGRFLPRFICGSVNLRNGSVSCIVCPHITPLSLSPFRRIESASSLEYATPTIAPVKHHSASRWRCSSLG